jgi:hypothetical protein
MAGRRRASKTGADMIRSLGLVLLAVLVVTLIGPARTLLLARTPRIITVGYREDVLGAHRLAPAAQLLQPAPAPSGWRATSARVTGGGGAPVRLHIGFYTADRQYAALEETNGPARPFLHGLLDGVAGRSGRLPVAGRTWAEVTGRNGQRGLLRTAGGVTVLLTGTAGWADLARLAAVLRAL